MPATTRRIGTAADATSLLPDDRFSPASRRALSAPGIRTFVGLCDAWGLDEAQRRRLLGSPPRSTYHNWLKAAREGRSLTLGLDELTRISAVLGIHKALRILHGDAREDLLWLRGAHGAPIFGGGSPLDLMTSGPLDALLTARRFLDAARGGLYMPPNGADDLPPSTEADIVFA